MLRRLIKKVEGRLQRSQVELIDSKAWLPGPWVALVHSLQKYAVVNTCLLHLGAPQPLESPLQQFSRRLGSP